MKKQNKIKNARTYTMHDRRMCDPFYGFKEVDYFKSCLDSENRTIDKEKIYKITHALGLRKDLARALDRNDYDWIANMNPNLELNQAKRNVTTPLVGKNSSQRLDMSQHQIIASNIPLRAERPIVESNMAQDVLTRSSCIYRADGKIKLMAKIRYQFRTIYVYELNGVYDYLDTDSLIQNNGFAVPEFTDLEELEVGEYYDLTKDNFLIAYPSCYNPNTDSMGYGVNVRCIVNTNFNNSGDPAPVSERFVRKFAVLKSKEVYIKLINKTIKSKYPNIFPELGQIIKGDNILFKVCQDDGILTDLAQSANIPSGSEDEAIMIMDNSYINRIEVYCNEPIDDPRLEKFRLEMLDFRRRVYNVIAPLVDKEYDKCSPDLVALKGNFEYSKFRVDSCDLTYPLIKINVVTIDIPTVGAKFSNLFGAKFTLQQIYPEGSLVDELGREIDFEFPSTAIINRTVGGIPWEVYITSFFDLLRHRVLHNEITPERAYEFVTKFYELLDLKSDWDYANMSVDELWTYLNERMLTLQDYPYSNNIDMKLSTKLMDLGAEYLGHREFDIYRGKKEKIKMTSPHVVGRMFIFRDLHDTEYGNSSSSEVVLNSQGTPSDKDASKRYARSLVTKKSCKMDVQFQHYALNIATNADCNIILNTNTSLYGVTELGESVGFRIQLGTDEENEALLNCEEDMED